MMFIEDPYGCWSVQLGPLQLMCEPDRYWVVWRGVPIGWRELPRC